MALATYLPRTFAQGKDGCGRQAGTHPGQRRRRAGLLVSGPRRFEQRPSGAQPWMVNCHVAPCPRRRERARGVARCVVGSYPPAAGGGHKRGARSPLGRGVILGCLRHHPIPSHPAPDDTLNPSVCCCVNHHLLPLLTKPARAAPLQHPPASNQFGPGPLRQSCEIHRHALALYPAHITPTRAT
jgi:hypothetical protein